MGFIEIFRDMGKNFKVCGYTFYLFESYKQIKCARSLYYTLLKILKNIKITKAARTDQVSRKFLKDGA